MATEPYRPPPLHHPARLVGTCFGIGTLPWAPGSWGSLAALPVAWLILDRAGPLWLAVAAGAVFVLGWWAAQLLVGGDSANDPGEIVIDEVAGQFLTLVVAAPEPAQIAAGFVLFRAADIVKPWPVSWAERRFKGGFGVMADDMVAGAMALAILYLFRWMMG